MRMAFRRTSGSNLAAHDVDVEGAVKLSATSTPKRVNRVAVTVSAVAIAAAATVGVVAHSLAPAGTPTVHSEDVALTAGADTAAIDASVKAILDGISYTGAGGATEYIGTSSLSNVLEYAFPSLNLQLGEVFSLVGLNDPTAADPTSGITTTVNELLNALNLGQLTPINDFLALLPVGSGDPVITGETTLGVILTDLQVPAPDGGSGTIDLGNVTINEILASFTLPGGGTLSDATTLGMLLNDYPSIANISLTGLLGGLSGGGSEGGLGGILSGLLGDLGGLGGVPTTVGGLVSTLGLDDDTIGSLLGFTSTTDLSDIASQLNIDGYSLDSILADLPSNGVTLTGASTLDQITDFFGVGGKTLAELIPGGADLTNNSTIVDLLNDTALFGNLGQQTIDSLLGLTSATAGEAAASLTASGSDVAASLF